MVVNVAISILVIVVYSYAIEPGHEEAFYESAASRIAPWSSVVFGAPLFFAVAWFCARRRPDRNEYVFSGSIVAVYAAVDLTVLLASGEIASSVGIIALSLATKAIGALAGARLGAAGTVPTPAT